jgi:hypothetical protein
MVYLTVQFVNTGGPVSEGLRTEVLPPLARPTGAAYLVGGSTAAVVGLLRRSLADRLPVFVAVVVGLSMDYEVSLLARRLPKVALEH